VSDDSPQPPSEDDLRQQMMELAEESLRAVVLVTGQQTDGSPFWAFVAMSPTQLAAFREVEAAGGGYVLDEYGEILSAGAEAEPPQQVVAYMQRELGFDPDFEQQIIDSLIPPDGETGT